jgi:hypothetical protein
LEGASVGIKNNNSRGLSLLCDEFDFRDLAAQLSQFRASDDFKEQTTTEGSEARMRLSELEERMQQHDKQIAALPSELSRQAEVHESIVGALLGRVGRLEAEVTTLRSITDELSATTYTALRTDSGKLRDLLELLTPGPPPSAPPSSVPAPTFPAASVPLALPSPSAWNSMIVPDFPKIFKEFKRKKFTLLWRSSRDGFGASDFHSRCNEHANTLTVILDTNGNIFGGLTLVKWESLASNDFKADPSLKSFLFALKNPHNVPAGRFAKKATKKHEAGYCNPNGGPCFGDDICIFKDCNANTNNGTCLGCMYTNKTGLDGQAVFADSIEFQVKEIEVFESSPEIPLINLVYLCFRNCFLNAPMP